MCHNNEEMNEHSHVIMTQGVIVEWRDQIQRYYVVNLNEKYRVKFLFMFQHSNQKNRVKYLFMTRILSQESLSYSTSSRTFLPPTQPFVSSTTPSGDTKRKVVWVGHYHKLPPSCCCMNAKFLHCVVHAMFWDGGGHS